MRVILPDAGKEKYSAVELNVGDEVIVTVWDTGKFQGRVKEIEKGAVIIHEATLIKKYKHPVYPLPDREFDYYVEKDTLRFLFEGIYSITSIREGKDGELS